MELYSVSPLFSTLVVQGEQALALVPAQGVRAQGQGTPAYFLCHIKQEGVGGAVGKAVTVDKEEKTPRRGRA